MDYSTALEAGVLAGLISTGIYESLRIVHEKWILHFKPLDCRLVTQQQYSSTPLHVAGPISLMFYMRNRTKRSLPVYFSMPNTAGSAFQFSGIQWMGRSGVFGTQDITLEPGEGGTFVFSFSVKKSGCFRFSLALDARPMGSNVKGKLSQLPEMIIEIE